MAYLDELLAPGETVLHRTRRHWIVLLRSAGGALLLAVLAVVLAIVYGVGSWTGSGTIALYAGGGLLLLAILLGMPGALRWAGEIYLVTDRRVIKVEGVLRKQALDSGLARINDVRLAQSALGRALGYGTLEIITASESGINRLEFLPRPLVFKRAMMTAAESREHPAALPGASALAGEAAPPVRTAAERLAELDELRRRQLLTDEEYRAKRAEILGAL